MRAVIKRIGSARSAEVVVDGARVDNTRVTDLSYDNEKVRAVVVVECTRGESESKGKPRGSVHSKVQRKPRATDRGTDHGDDRPADGGTDGEPEGLPGGGGDGADKD